MADGTWTAWLFVAATKYIYILKLTRKVRGHGTNVMRVSRAARSLKNGLSIFMWRACVEQNTVGGVCAPAQRLGVLLLVYGRTDNGLAGMFMCTPAIISTVDR